MINYERIPRVVQQMKQICDTNEDALISITYNSELKIQSSDSFHEKMVISRYQALESLLDPKKSSKRLRSQIERAFDSTKLVKPNMNFIFLAVLEILKNLLIETFPEIYMYCMNFVRRLRDEVYIGSKSIAQLHEFDKFDEGKLNDPANYAKIVFQKILRNNERFEDTLPDQKLTYHLAHLCKLKISRDIKCMTNSEKQKLFDLIVNLYKKNHMSIIQLWHIIGIIQSRDEENVSEFCRILKPHIEDLEDPYFQDEKMIIIEKCEDEDEK